MTAFALTRFRLIDHEGNQKGITATREALALARSLDLDLVEIAPTAQPPVCRIMDYGKFKFDEAQKAKESRRKLLNVGIEEMKYRPKVGAGDFNTKRDSSRSSSVRVTRSRSPSCSADANRPTPSSARRSLIALSNARVEHRPRRVSGQAERSQHDHGPRSRQAVEGEVHDDRRSSERGGRGR
jgi:hypothetical protein